MLLFYHILLNTVWIASPKEHEKKRWERIIIIIIEEFNAYQERIDHYIFCLPCDVKVSPKTTWKGNKTETEFTSDRLID